jgi:hypothetical protein
MPDDIAGLWFSAPDVDLNFPQTFFVGSKSFDERRGREDWASEAAWTQDELARESRNIPKSHPPDFDIRAPWEIQRRLGLGPGFDRDSAHLDRIFGLAAGLSLLHLGLLIRHAFKQINVDLVLGNRHWRGVGYGFASGDLLIIGILTRKKSRWVLPGRTHRVRAGGSVAIATASPLDIDSGGFDPAAYLDAHLDVNARSPQGRTPLIRLLAQTSPDSATWDLVERYLRRGADVNIGSALGFMPMLALARGPTALLRLALDAGGSPNAVNTRGRTPLVAAVGCPFMAQNIKLLLGAGANPHHRDAQGRTVVHMLASVGDVNMDAGYVEAVVQALHLLVKAGVDVDERDVDGLTPMDVIRSRRANASRAEVAIVQALASHFAKASRSAKRQLGRV